ncbi:MAG: GNAT family protein [Cellvibrionales bacterium]|nr:GNAT family protein [Cellvibrionales bacterium]
MNNAGMNGFGQPVGDSLDDWQGAKLPGEHTLSGKFCRLERLDVNRHVEPLFDVLCEAAFAKNWTYLPYGPFETFDRFLTWLTSVSSDKDPLFFVVVNTQDSSALGLVSFLAIQPQRGSIEVGHVHYSSQLQRTAIATEAMFLMMQHVFDGCGYRRYEWKCDNHNEKSKKAALRLGFQFEGVFRQHLVYKGRSRDTAWFSVLDNEWPSLQQAYVAWLSASNFDAQGRQKKSLVDCMDEVKGRDRASFEM